MRLVRKATIVFDRTLDILFFLATIILVLITLTVVTEIIMRTFWNRPITGTVQIIGYALLYMTFLGAAWLLRDDGHVKMEVVLARLKPGTQALLNIITSTLGAIVCLIIAWYGVRVLRYILQVDYRAIQELEVSLFPIVLIIPVGSFLLFIQFLRRTYGYIKSRRAASGKGQGL